MAKKKKSKNAGSAKSGVKSRARKNTGPQSLYLGSNKLIALGYKLTAQKKIKELIGKFESADLSVLSKNEQIEYYRLLGFAYCNSNRFLDGERCALSGLDLDENDRDFHFSLGFIYVSMKDYKTALNHIDKFLELAKSAKDKDNSNYLSSGHEQLVYNFQGLSYKAIGDIEKAEDAFRNSIGNKTKDHQPYLNLAALYAQRGEREKAQKVLKDGLKNCTQAQELRLMQKSMNRSQTISACMIVKNEEKLLPNCLESIRNWVDEIVVVDTGSTDKTVEIAKSYGAKVYYQEWQNDFSFHRNYSISKATCDWIFIIDADEEWASDDLTELWQAMSKKEFNLVSINVFNMNRETGVHSSFLPSSRFIKRSSGIKYDGIVHNQLTIDNSEVIPRTKLKLYHYGYDLSSDVMDKKYQRTLSLLQNQLEKDPDDCFAHFNMAQLLRSFTGDDPVEHNEKIIYHAKRAVELSNTDPKGSLSVHLQGHHQQVSALFNMKRYAEAEEVCHKVLKIKPDYLDPLISLGHICSAQYKLEEAETAFLKYLEEHEKYDPSKEMINYILVYINHQYAAYYGIALIKQHQKDYDAAIEFYKKTLEFIEPYQETYCRLASIYLDKNEIETAYEYLQKELETQNDTDLLNLNLARYYGMKNNIEKADEYLTKANELTEGRPEIYERAGVFYANLGRYAEAIDMFTNLIRVKPSYSHGYTLLAKASFDGGDYESSAKYYGLLTKMVADDAAIWNDLAGSYYKIEQYENAEKAYSKALSIDENMANAYRNLGLTKLKLEKNQEALALLENYSRMNPSDIDIIKALGTIYLNLNDFSSAINHLETALQHNSDDMETLYYLSECYYHMGYGDSAAVGYAKIMERNPDFEPARNRLNEIETAKMTS